MIRWGVLGTAQVNRRLIPAMRSARRSTLAAVASRDGARARAYAADWQIPVAHDSYEALLRDAAIDAVYLPLPNALHVEWTRECSARKVRSLPLTAVFVGRKQSWKC